MSSVDKPVAAPSSVPDSTTDSPPKEEAPLPAGWARIASKKRPGKFYYFNATTNQSLWEHPAKALTREAKIVANVAAGSKKGKAVKGGTEEKVVQLKNDTQFKKKNLAKDRMDKIRTQLEEEKKKDEGKKVAKKIASPKKKPEVKPVSAPKKTEIPKPEAKPIVSEKKPEVKKVASPKKSVPKKPEVAKSSPLRQKRKLAESPKSAKRKLPESPKTSVKSHAIVKKPSPKKAEVKSQTIQMVKKEVKALKTFKIPKKPPEEPVSSPLFVDIKKLDEVKPPPEVPKSVPSPKIASEPPRCQSTPKVAIPPPETFSKSPANDRLAALRNQITQNVTFDEDAEMTDLSLDTSAVEEQVEQMDWEDINEEEALQEVVTVRQLKLTTPNSTVAIPTSQANLLDQTTTFQRFFFVVIDTNVFLSNLKPLEQILTAGVTTVGQPILIVPYIVLQELDRIKHREAGRPLSQAACRSIRFLNEYLKRRDPRVRGQSTIEAAAPIIPIDNPDDHIVNCCLQVARQIVAGTATELLLLSNDVNLRNKALVSGLTAVSFGELTAETERLRKVAVAASG